jgi:cytochrome P450
LRAAAEYFDALADRRKARPGPDLISHMVTASEDGDQLSRHELIAMALLMLPMSFAPSGANVGPGQADANVPE